MTAAALTLVLASALLHASWNLLVKSSGDRLVAAWMQAVFGALVFSPVLVLRGIPTEVLGAIVASSVIHLAYGLALVAAYERADLSLVYPVARGTAPILATVAAAVWLADVPEPAGLVSIGLVVLGLFVVGLGGDRSGIGWAVATGVTIATYTVVDANAVRTVGESLPYTTAVFAGNALTFLPVVLARRGARRALAAVTAEPVRHVLAGAASAGAYAMVLGAARVAPIGLVAAFRETSVVFGAVGGWLFLRERLPGRRIAGAAAVVAGLVVLVTTSVTAG